MKSTGFVSIRLLLLLMFSVLPFRTAAYAKNVKAPLFSISEALSKGDYGAGVEIFNRSDRREFKSLAERPKFHKVT